MANNITVSNDSLQDLIFCLHNEKDMFQAVSIQQIKIPSSGTDTFSPSSPGTYLLHVYRPGLFGLISLRTRESAGYGFPVTTGSSYRINKKDVDPKGNRVSCTKEVNGEDPYNIECIVGSLVTLSASSDDVQEEVSEDQERAAERRRIAMEKVSKIRAEKYEARKQEFALCVTVVMSGSSISQEQLMKLWEKAAPLQAEDAAAILAANVSSASDTVKKDEAGAESQFQTVLEMLLQGQTIDSKQITLLSNIGNHLTSSTLVAVITRMLKVTYDAREAARQAKIDQENQFKSKFRDVLRVVLSMDRVTADHIQLLLSAAATLPATWVNDTLASENTSWDNLQTRVSGTASPGSSPVMASGAPPPPPPPPPRRHTMMSSALQDAIHQNGQQSLKHSASQGDVEAVKDGAIPPPPPPPRRQSMNTSLMDDIVSGKSNLKKPGESARSVSPPKKGTGSIFDELKGMLQVRRLAVGEDEDDFN